MLSKRLLVVCTLPVLLSACVGPSRFLDIMDKEKAIALSQDVIVVDDAPKDAEFLGTVTGASCRNKVWEPEPTEDEALIQLKAHAKQKGAIGVAKVTYESRPETSIAANCWSAIYAAGVAFK